MDYQQEAEAVFDFTQGIRRDLHMYPELGFQEIRTAGVVTRELTELGIENISGIAKTGVVGIIDSGKPGPVVMLRFDMDALPITEETGAPYASKIPGVMHACGHDAHVAIGLTVARMINQHRENLRGIVKFVFQPAEEGLGGAESMIQSGVLENPRPDYALGIHVWNDAPVGWLGISPGPVMAASEIFNLKIIGRGGHGAIPSLAIDPILAASQVVSALQSIVSRNVNPFQTAVVSVTSFHGGQAHNVIPQEVELKGTIRSFDPEIRSMVIRRFHEIVEQVSLAMGCKTEVEVRSLTPAVRNHKVVTDIAIQTATNLWPRSNINTHYMTMGSEDMAFYLQEIPGSFIFIGSANEVRGLNASHHHPKFDIDEQVMPMAVALICATTEKILNNL
jgi:amidohydrolase